MKVATLKQIVNEIQNMDIEKAKNIIKDLDKKSDDEIIFLLNKLKDYNFNEYAYDILITKAKDLLEKITMEELLQLVDKVKESNFNKLIYEIAINSYVLENRTIEEQLQLMDVAINLGSIWAYSLAINPYVLEKTPLEVQIQFMNKISEVDRNNVLEENVRRIYKILVNENMETNIKGIYACRRLHRRVTTNIKSSI